MSGPPLVSIIIPVYNGSNYIADAIESALDQTHLNTEVIVVDDGSSDGGATAAVVARYGNHVRYLHQQNGGVAAALNHGIAAMRGDYFSWLSHDDIYLPDKVERQVEVARSFGAPCVVVGDFQHMAANGQLGWEYSSHLINLGGRPLDAIFRSAINGCALLISKEAFSICGTFETRLPTTQDYHLWFRMAHRIPFIHCPHVGVRQRLHPDQGSWQSGHLDEVARMLINCIEQTPPERMCGYSGSEIRFLIDLLPVMQPHPTVVAYLDGRIGALLPRALRYGVVILSDADEDGLGRVLKLLKRHRWTPLDRAVIPPPDGQDAFASTIRAAAKAVATDWILIWSARHAFAPDDLQAALTHAITTNSAILEPAGLEDESPSAHGLLFHRSTLPVLLAGPGRPVAEAGLAVSAYPVSRIASPALESASPGPDAIPTPGILEAALNGKALIDYADGIDAEACTTALTRSRAIADRPGLLFLTPAFPDDTHEHLDRLTAALAPHAECLVGYGGPGAIRLCRSTAPRGGGILFAMPRHATDLAGILRRSHVVRTDVHSILTFEREAAALLDALALPYDLTILDDSLFPRPAEAMAGVDDGFTRDGEQAAAWREHALPLLRGADRAVALSRDAAARIGRMMPDIHPIAAAGMIAPARTVRHVFPPHLRAGTPLRVLVTGSFQQSRDRELVLTTAAIASSRRLPIRFHLFDDLQFTAAEREAFGEGLIVEEASGERDLAVASIAPHVAWLPQSVPQAWNVTLSRLLNLALPIAAMSLGATTERCSGRALTWLLPPDTSAASWADFFLELQATALRKPSITPVVDDLPPQRHFFVEAYVEPLCATDRDAP